MVMKGGGRRRYLVLCLLRNLCNSRFLHLGVSDMRGDELVDEGYPPPVLLSFEKSRRERDALLLMRVHDSVFETFGCDDDHSPQMSA